MNTPTLCNLLGTGAIPPDVEAGLLAEGVKFASYHINKRGRPILVASIHPDIYQRYVEQIVRQDEQERGLPVEYRIPASAPAAPVPQAVIP